MDKEAKLTQSPSSNLKTAGSGKDQKKSNEDPQKAVMEIITEFIESGELDEAMSDIDKRVDIEGTEFVKRALIFGIEHKAYERELISQLLSAVYNIFHGNEVAGGFQILLDRLPDMILDVPDATEVLAKFLSRGFYDEILYPIFLEEAKVNNDHARRVLSIAKSAFDKPEERRRLDHVWGPGDFSSVTRLRDEVEIFLKEYLENDHIKDAIQSLRSLNAPSFNSQVIKQALILAIESHTSSHSEAILRLIKGFYEISLVSSYDVLHGFKLVWRRLSDIQLDVPNASQKLQELTNKAKNMNILEKDFEPEK